MRVISGKLRGRKIGSLETGEIRPTMDRSKEGLFNVIHFDVDGCDFLDLFSGTGNIGIEAISRGANSVDFVDNCQKAIKLINSNLQSYDIKENVILSDTLSYVSTCQKKYDIIFLDPPYDFDPIIIDDIINNIKKKKLLNKNGILILEYDCKKILNLKNVYKEKKYGISKFYFMREL